MKAKSTFLTIRVDASDLRAIETVRTMIHIAGSKTSAAAVLRYAVHQVAKGKQKQ